MFQFDILLSSSLSSMTSFESLDFILDSHAFLLDILELTTLCDIAARNSLIISCLLTPSLLRSSLKFLFILILDLAFIFCLISFLGFGAPPVSFSAFTSAAINCLYTNKRSRPGLGFICFNFLLILLLNPS